MRLSKQDWLKFQVGITEQRQLQAPVYEGGHLDHHRTTSEQHGVFHLLGWGKTIDEAYRMAGEPFNSTLHQSIAIDDHLRPQR